MEKKAQEQLKNFVLFPGVWSCSSAVSREEFCPAVMPWERLPWSFWSAKSPQHFSIMTVLKAGGSFGQERHSQCGEVTALPWHIPILHLRLWEHPWLQEPECLQQGQWDPEQLGCQTPLLSNYWGALLRKERKKNHEQTLLLCLTDAPITRIPVCGKGSSEITEWAAAHQRQNCHSLPQQAGEQWQLWSLTTGKLLKCESCTFQHLLEKPWEPWPSSSGHCPHRNWSPYPGAGTGCGPAAAPASAPGPAAGSSSSAPAAPPSELYQAGNSVLLHFHCGNVHLQQLDPVHCFPLLLLVKNKGWQGEEEQN